MNKQQTNKETFVCHHYVCSETTYAELGLLKQVISHSVSVSNQYSSELETDPPQ